MIVLLLLFGTRITINVIDINQINNQLIIRLSFLQKFLFKCCCPVNSFVDYIVSHIFQERIFQLSYIRSEKRLRRIAFRKRQKI